MKNFFKLNVEFKPMYKPDHPVNPLLPYPGGANPFVSQDNLGPPSVMNIHNNVKTTPEYEKTTQTCKNCIRHFPLCVEFLICYPDMLQKFNNHINEFKTTILQNARNEQT